MRRLSILGLAPIAVAGACSLINAPADVIPGTGGTGGAHTTTTSSTSATSSTTSVTTTTSSTTSTSSGSGGGCASDADCPATTVACQKNTCMPGGACQLAPLLDATACDDGDPCTGQGACLNGACQKGSDLCAAMATECIDVTCTPTGCMPANKLDGTGCGMSFCSNGTCKSGHCNIVALNEGTTCDDGKFCTINDKCRGGFCVGDPNPCPSGAPCVKGTCDEASHSCVMTPIQDHQSCDDGNACTAGEFCMNQVCMNGLAPTVLFNENFTDNSKGWTLGTEWQIGKAKISGNQQFGYPDPPFDHDGNGGVAGVEIGGNAQVAEPDPTHAPFYLTSPTIDAVYAGTIYLTFYRWLNSDYAPYMHNVIEVSPDGGTTWTQVWETTTLPITDSQWTFESIDVTTWATHTFRFRFGFSIGDPGVFSVSSWNLDTVKVQNAPCPM